ncbi:MAG: hypothetical protein AAGH64_04340 [Planctomycetota bacterium]
MITAPHTLALVSLIHAQPAQRVVALEPARSPTVAIGIDLRRASDPAWGDRLIVYDNDSEIVEPQGYLTGARVFVGEGITYIDRKDRTGSITQEPAPVASPKLLLESGGEGGIVIGEPVLHARLDADGATMRVASNDEHYEGVAIDVTPVALGTGGVRFERFDISTRRVAGRMDVVDDAGAATVALPAGEPIMQTVTYSLPIRLGAGERAIVVLPAGHADDAVFVIAIDATVDPG